MAASRVGDKRIHEKEQESSTIDISSDSESEPEPAKIFHRRISTNKDIRTSTCTKQGFLHKQTNFQRWKRRFFKLKGRKLYYAKDTKSSIFDEIELTDLSVAECSTKNINHSFQVITPFRNLVLCAETRKEMEEWISALKMSSKREYVDGNDSQREMMSGLHNWYTCSHARPTYCNVCREALSGVTSHGLSCEVCKFKAHKRCAVKAQSNCKWTTLSAIGAEIIEDEDGITMPHQWLEGNLNVSSRCTVCDKICGSVRKLQDWRCLWCKTTVHSGCRGELPKKCPLSQCRVSILLPTAINSIDSDGYWEAMRPPGTSPLLVFVNTKSGDNQGVKFLRRFKQLLNPAQVFDLMNGGPHPGLRLFQKFDQFRILVCGGDGSIGWVLSEIDNMDLHRQCQIGVLPFGTGNDLARVLGWGSAFDDDTQLPAILEKMEHSQIKMLDRWSIWTYEGYMPPPRKLSQQFDPISQYEDSVANHLSKILHSEDHSTVISSAKVLCETVKDFVAKVGRAHREKEEDADMADKCATLNEKLESLLKTLNEEAQASSQLDCDSSAMHNDPHSSIMNDLSVTFDPNLVTNSNSVHTDDSMDNRTSYSENSSESSQTENRSDTIAEDLFSGDPESPAVKSRLPRQRSHHNNRQLYENRDIPRSCETRVHGQIPPSAMKPKPTIFKPRDALMSRANSLKKAIRQIIEHTERAVDEQNAQTMEQTRLLRGTSGSSGDLVTPFSATQSPLQAGSPNSRSAPSFSVFTADTTPKSPQLHRLKFDVCDSLSASSRRISSMSTLNKASSMGSNLDSPAPPKDPQPGPSGLLTYPFANYPVLPNLSSSIAGRLAGGSFISKVLLANADALCAAASPLLEEDIPLEEYTERCVMNNYLGIGLDAKIMLDFQNRREEHPEKFRSRTKNRMWYGVLGGKEILQKTFKNLDQRVQLECDGQRIPLPSLQGIVILNIPSFGGGSNFWGGTKEVDTFSAPSFDDKILEVVAVFGSTQLAVSRVIDLQHHRIAQCRTVKIMIMGDEGVPVQVDGEAWIQPPGYIRIVHKNRAQMLTRDRSFETVLKSWSEKQKAEPMLAQCSPSLSADETVILQTFVEVASALIKVVKVASLTYSSVEQELFPLATRASEYMDRLYPSGQLVEPTLRSQVVDFVHSVRNLTQETSNFLTEKAPDMHMRSDITERLSQCLVQVEEETRTVMDVCAIPTTPIPQEEFVPTVEIKHRPKPGRFKQVVSKLKGKKDKDKSYIPLGYNVNSWSSEDVGQWLDNLSLSEYRESFIKHEIRGTELLSLDKTDIQDLGVHKVGHLKRIQHGIKELSNRMSAMEKYCNNY
ncbi:diacylglycerol kinase delta-like isoform X2 [Mya arenaria]|uniref:diacylglycerol kinase delta-like isoform X2 n=1 Tax=Mya arenaria TaxID=6604 RepID=UPI0022E7B902|nr:diacylglycerol kinase delta-like isoform X2 [Mya arenaria]